MPTALFSPSRRRAEAEGFEPSRSCPLAVFKTAGGAEGGESKLLPCHDLRALPSDLVALLGVLLGADSATRAELVGLVTRWSAISHDVRAAALRVVGVPPRD
jgi:hypothetical protein